MSYNVEQVKRLKLKRKVAYDKYWNSVDFKMRSIYFLECVIKKRESFNMTFEHKFWEDEECNKMCVSGFDKANGILIEFYANKNRLAIINVYSLGNKSIYTFGKAN